MHVGLVLALLALPAQANDPVQVAANLSDAEIQVGETAVLEIVVETRGPDVESLELPDLPDGLEVTGTRDYSQLQFSLPGGRSRALRREVILTATATGDFVIRSATVHVDGVPYRTRPLSLRVSGSPTASAPSTAPSTAPPDTPAASDGDDVRLRAWIAPDTAYVGQQVTLHAESMWASDIRMRLRRIPQLVPPDITGFWMEELPEDRSSPRSVGGRRYERSSYRRALFPISPGTFHLPPARLRYDMRRGFSYNPDPEELVSDSLRVVVLPLPAEGQPDTFTGAVGRFNIVARTEPTRVTAGEAVNLIVEISGEGNIKALPAPTIPKADGMRAFQPSEETELTTDSAGILGTKRFSWVLVPENSGTLEIPAIEYAYFDPVDARYRVARSATLAVNVGPATGGGEASASEEVESASIRLFKPEPGPPARLAWVRSGPFAALQFLPLLGVLLVLWYRKPLPPRRPSVRVLRRQRRRQLQALHVQAASVDPDFFTRLATAVRAAIRKRTGIERSRLEPGQIVGALLQAGVTDATATAMRDLIARANELRYRPDPAGAEDQLALLHDAEHLLEEIDRQAHAPPVAAAAGMRGATAGLLLLLSLGGLPMATNATARLQTEPVEEHFRTATDAVTAGDYDRATAAFLDYVARAPGDAHGWYNLGNAAYLAGQPGTAIWAWLRASRIAPRDSDPRHNLRLAGVPAEIVRRNTPLIPLSTDEVLLLASLVWFLGAIALILYALRDRRAAGPVGVAALLVAALLIASWAVPRIGAPRAIVLENQAQLLTAPAERAEARLSVEPGTQLRIVDRRDRWFRVSARGGTEGWIEAERVGRL